MSMQLKKLISELSRRISLIASRCVIGRVDDSTKTQTVQVTALAGETIGGIERFQQYGFTSAVLEGAEGILLSLGGRREHAIVIATEDKRYRLKTMADGEVALWDDQGQYVHIKRNSIEISGTTKVEVKAPTVEAVADTFTAKQDPAGSSIQADATGVQLKAGPLATDGQIIMTPALITISAADVVIQENA
jgi:phage baseplate assembly protein V